MKKYTTQVVVYLYKYQLTYTLCDSYFQHLCLLFMMLTSSVFSLLDIDTCDLFFSVQIKEPAELMTHESSTIRGHHNIGIHPEDRGMGPYSSYGMHTLFYSLIHYSFVLLCTYYYYSQYLYFDKCQYICTSCGGDRGNLDETFWQDTLRVASHYLYICYISLVYMCSVSIYHQVS